MKYNTQPIAEVMDQAITKLKGMKTKEKEQKAIQLAAAAFELLEALIILQLHLEQLIIVTPTGESRNAMTEDNINALIAIKKATS